MGNGRWYDIDKSFPHTNCSVRACVPTAVHYSMVHSQCEMKLKLTLHHDNEIPHRGKVFDSAANSQLLFAVHNISTH